ncbi:MAG: transporter substrate-binding domain-containing protein [Pseudolabrys sp.]|nr:transporter substrate-binding domain-containing protein [Pseudolabrys sp.]
MPALAQTAAPTKLDEIVTKGVLKVGMPGDYKPFGYYDQATGKFEGFDADMAEALGQALGVKVEFVKTSWPTLMKDYEAGAFDMGVGGISITLDRAKKAYFSTAMMREGKTPITLCTNKDKFATLEQIDKPGVKIVVNPGGTNERFARANVKAADIRVYPDNNTIFNEIIKGDADLMMTDSSETLYQQKLHPELCSVHPDKPFDFAEKAYLLPRDAAFKLFVDQWLHIIRENGAYQAMYSKYFG